MNPKQVNVLDTADADPDQIETGRASAAGGRAVFEDIQRAVKLTEERKIGGFVAGLHNKCSVRFGRGSLRRVPALSGATHGKPLCL
ncbi:MAG: hypothetical protein MZU91_12005 [Desulfosudis oleivorans]|nr:hypothetical protein [Desulfosudis oleivorans]